jgi:hypothetical protein
MSTIWTPSGERPVGREEPRRPSTATSTRGDYEEPSQDEPSQGEPSQDEPSQDQLSDEELAAELDDALQRLAGTPASTIVANHVLGLFELARLHLAQDPPNFPEAQLAIDAMAAVVEGLGDRLADATAPLRDALAQIRLAFVQLRAARSETSDR